MSGDVSFAPQVSNSLTRPQHAIAWHIPAHRRIPAQVSNSLTRPMCMYGTGTYRSPRSSEHIRANSVRGRCILPFTTPLKALHTYTSAYVSTRQRTRQMQTAVDHCPHGARQFCPLPSFQPASLQV